MPYLQMPVPDQVDTAYAIQITVESKWVEEFAREAKKAHAKHYADIRIEIDGKRYELSLGRLKELLEKRPERP